MFSRYQSLFIATAISATLAAPAAWAVVLAPNGTGGYPILGTVDGTGVDGTVFPSTAPIDAGIDQLSSAFNRGFVTDNARSVFTDTDGIDKTTTSSDPSSIGTIPVVLNPFSDTQGPTGAYYNAGGYFEFLFDAQEAGQEGNTAADSVEFGGVNSGPIFDTGLTIDTVIDNIQITWTNPNNNMLHVIWEYDATAVNPDGPNSPIVVVNNAQSDNALLGNGADLALYVPVSAFVQAATAFAPGGEFTSADNLVFTWTQYAGSNGKDEWILRDCSELDVFCFDGPIVELPLPGALPLLLAGLGGLALIGRRRRASAG